MKMILKVYFRDERVEEYDLDRYFFGLERGWVEIYRKESEEKIYKRFIAYPSDLISKVEVLVIYETEPIGVYQ